MAPSGPTLLTQAGVPESVDGGALKALGPCVRVGSSPTTRTAPLPARAVRPPSVDPFGPDGRGRWTCNIAAVATRRVAATLNQVAEGMREVVGSTDKATDAPRTERRTTPSEAPATPWTDDEPRSRELVGSGRR
jgi:hypothetical protein